MYLFRCWPVIKLAAVLDDIVTVTLFCSVGFVFCGVLKFVLNVVYFN